MTNLAFACTAVIFAFTFFGSGTQAVRTHAIANPSGRPESFVSVNAANADEDTSLEKFVGTWEGKCQDDRTFVVVSLKENGKELAGTVSIGNMHGDDVGACMLVLAPPSPEHAQNVNDGVVKGSTLSFHGAKRPDGTAATFELMLTQKDQAQLKLMGTPVADHPWELTRANSK